MKRQTIFRYVNSAFHQLHCLKFSLKLGNISRSYEENKTAPFSVHSVFSMFFAARLYT